MTIDVSAGPHVAGPAGPAPARRPGSVRRTSTLDTRWPGGFGSPLRITGRARDLLTPYGGGRAQVLSEDRLTVGVAADRTIQDISADPARPELQGLVGARGGGRLRGVLADVAGEELAAGTPLYLMLDDLAGATLVAGFAFSQWPQLWPAEWTKREEGGGSGTARRMEGICTGFQPGSSALTSDGSARWTHDVRAVLPLSASSDPLAWHPLDDPLEVSMRRARRIDVTVTAGVLHVDAMFQDSATTPAGGRVAVHEYLVEATSDLGNGRLLSVSADPRVLPYAECPLAARNVHLLVGTPLTELRSVVLERLKGIAGCTHLNDALRALAEVPVLAAALTGDHRPT